MASARYAWGIDIGNRALKAVKLVRDGDQLRVDDFDLIEHEHVLSNAGDNRESLIQTALANFVQRHPMKSGGAVAVGVSGQSSFARFIKLPPVEEKKIPEIVRFEAIQQIPFPLDEVEWSYQLFRNPESPDVEVGIFAMRKELIARHIGYFTDFDLNVQVVQTNPLAVYNAMAYDQRLKGTTMVIDLGAENTDLIICDSESVWMRSIAIGGNNFTETLVKGFKLPFAKAEDLKRNAATSKYARQIFQAMRPVFADLVAEIQRSVGFYASVHKDSRIKKIIALGGTFRLPGLQKYLQQNLSLDVERLDNLGGGAPADPKLAATFNENLLSVVSAYGLAAQAMGEGKITSSLLPASIRREKAWKEKTPIFGAAAACFVLGTGIALAGYFTQNLKFEAAADTRRKIAAIESDAKPLDSDWSTIESSGSTERAAIQNVLKLADYRDLWPKLLHDLAAAVPKPKPEVAQGILESKPELIKKVPRDQRNLVTIETMQTLYKSNMGTYVAASDADFKSAMSEFTNSGGGFSLGNETPQAAADPNATAGPVERGFLILIKGTSPNANAPTLIETDFCGALKKIAPTEKMPRMKYAVRKAVAVGANRISESQIRMGQLKAAYDAALQAKQRALQGMGGAALGIPGFGGAGMGAAGGGGAPDDMGGGGGGAGGYGQGMPPPPPAGGPPIDDKSAYMDRLLPDEEVLNDWEFTVLVAVTLDPAPPVPGAPSDQPAPATPPAGGAPAAPTAAAR